MSTISVLSEASQRLDEGLVWLVYRARQAWDALARSASGEGLSGSGGAIAAPGPPVVLMTGGLTTLAVVMTLFMARRSLSSTPDPVNTRGSRKKARESVDIYVDGEEADRTSDLETAIVSEPDGGAEETDRGQAPAGDATSSNWTVVQTRTRDPAAGSHQAASSESGSLQTVTQEEVEDDPPDGRTDPGPRPLGAFQRGRSAGQRVRATDASEVLDALQAANLGQPVIQQSTPNLFEIKLDGCRGCRQGKPADTRNGEQDACPFEAGFLEGAMSRVQPGGVVVRETACRRRGAEACVFEVWY